VRFPGPRVAKHYFPVTGKSTVVPQEPEADQRAWYLVGLDQTLVDIEVRDVPEGLLEEFGLLSGESVLLDEQRYRRLWSRLAPRAAQMGISPGGAVGNTLNNFVHLSGEPAVLLGVLPGPIHHNDPAFHYVAKTAPAVDLSHMVERPGNVATALTFIGEGGERSFAVSMGVSNDFPPEAVPADVVRNAAAVLTTLYCLREPSWPIARAAVRMMELACAAGVPVALGMATASLVRERRAETQELLERYVTLAAMNAAEAEALTGEADVLLAAQRVLDWVDLVIITEGPRGITLGGYSDEPYRRQTKGTVRSKSIPDYNRWEYSRMMRRAECSAPQKTYSHIHPFRGGPDLLRNTNGAGDAALAALIHDITANLYHRALVPDSRKHVAPVPFLTYSSLSRCAQYGNRVAYEVLRGSGPRLVGPVGPDEEGEESPPG